MKRCLMIVMCLPMVAWGSFDQIDAEITSLVNELEALAVDSIVPPKSPMSAREYQQYPAWWSAYEAKIQERQEQVDQIKADLEMWMNRRADLAETYEGDVPEAPIDKKALDALLMAAAGGAGTYALTRKKKER